MRPMFPVGLAASWRRLIAVFVTDTALLAIGGTFSRPGWWAAAAAGAGVTLMVLVRWRGAPLLTLLARPRIAVPGPVTDHRRTFGDAPVGIRSLGPHLVAVVVVDGPPHSLSVLDHQQVESAAVLPLDVVASGLRQCDVTLDGIDVISAGVRRAPKTHHHHAPVYSSRVGDHPAVGQRRTWLVMRVDAVRAAAAILCRESAAATLSAAAEHLAEDLTSRRCPARVLTAAEIKDVDKTLLAGADRSSVRRQWGRLRHRGGYIQTYWVSPGDISSTTIDRLWAPDTDNTVVTVQLRPTDDGGTTVGVVVRYHTGGPLREAPLTGLNPLTGRHQLGLAAGLVLPTESLASPCRRMMEDLSTPIGATGIIVGTTQTGHPLLVDLTPPSGKVTTVAVAGELALTVQVALRAAATGYQVLVHTARPECWRQATAAGLQLVGLAGLSEQLPASTRPWLVVYDELSGPVPDGTAVIMESRAGSSADIQIDQDDDTHILIRTWEVRHRLRVDLDYERHLVGSSGACRAAG
jgi:type VII secretion protein EccE